MKSYELTTEDMSKINGGVKIDPSMVTEFIAQLKTLKAQGYTEDQARTQLYTYPGFSKDLVDALIDMYWNKV